MQLKLRNLPLDLKLVLYIIEPFVFVSFNLMCFSRDSKVGILEFTAVIDKRARGRENCLNRL